MAERPRILDLFCGAGGAAMGYHRAGFDVVGVDNRPQPHYPFEFIQCDALKFFRSEDWVRYGWRYDAIHASPPCQFYSVATLNHEMESHVDLVAATRDLLQATGLPYVIENVPGAPLISPTTICGGALGLTSGDIQLHRHRLFEATFMILAPPCAQQTIHTGSVVGHSTPSWSRKKLGRNVTVAEKRELMGIDWMNRDELAQAIPPAYTELIGHQLLAHIQSGVAA